MQKFNMPALCGLLLLLLLGACSGLRLAYNHGDTLMYWWLDSYVDLDAEQRPWVRQDIDGLFQWHRQTQLNDYAQILQTAQRQLQDNVTAADLRADYDAIKQRTETLLLKALPELADLARSLKPGQIVQMEKKFAANNAEFRKKVMKGDREAQQRFRYEKSLEQFELWFGSFSSAQQAVIRRASDARPLDNALWLDERMRRQKLILGAVRKIQQEKLSKEASLELLRPLVQDLFERMERPSERKAFFDAYNDSTIQLVLLVIQLATPAQKAHAHQRMQGWINDFQLLAADQH